MTDHQEAFQFQGRFNPNDPDTDDDGTSDFVEAFPQGDEDQDGLSNGDEAAKGTSPTRPDSDCDGVQNGPEANYWGPNWNTGGNRLLDPDVDGDGVLDGVEVGTVGSPRDAVYRTRPDLSDTEADGLGDNQGDSNRVTVQCATSPSSSASSTGPDASDPKSFCNDPAGPGLQPLRREVVKRRQAIRP